MTASSNVPVERRERLGGLLRQAGPTLLKLLALQQPNNHDFAYRILQQVSGKDLGERDVAAWQRWLAEQH